MTKEMEYDTLNDALIDMYEVVHAMFMYDEQDEIRKEAERLYDRIKERKEEVHGQIDGQ